MVPPPVDPARPTRRSIWSSGMRAETLAVPDRVNTRAVGRVNSREMFASGSDRGGNGVIRCRVIDRVRRLSMDDAPAASRRLVGILTTSTMWTPGTSTSARPTADAAAGVVVSSLTASMVTRRVWKVRVGKSMVCPPGVFDAAPRETVTGWPPSNVRVALVIRRRRVPVWGCTRVTWSVVVGVENLACHHCPAGLATKVPVTQAVSRLPSTALYARFSGVYDTVLPYDDAVTSTAPT